MGWAMEPHDGIGSNITAVRLMLERKIAESGHTDHELDNIVAMLKTISSDTRQISRNLHPSVLEEIPHKAKLTIYRTAQESLNNIIKHSCRAFILKSIGFKINKK